MADVLLVVLDASAVLGVRSDLHNDGGSYLAALTHRLSSEGLLNGHSLPLIVVLNKMDLLSAEKVDSSQSAFSQDTADHSSESGAAVQQLLGKSTAFGNSSSAIVMQLSCKTGKGADAVVRRLQSLAESLCGSRSGAETAPLITRHRHRELLKACVSALLRYEDSWDELELAAEELRSAARDLGSITGAIETEEVLEAIFSEFCIGK
uniref:MnmE helical domain-containing protein n=1 Tax=Tetraselmis chuii TaxID=63592 RepID=A0A7S1SWQ7_9CHLO